MMGRLLCHKIQQVSQMCLQRHENPHLEGVGGNPVPTLGHAEVDVGIRNGVYKGAVVISARRKRPNFIIGANLISWHSQLLSVPARSSLPLGKLRYSVLLRV